MRRITAFVVVPVLFTVSFSAGAVAQTTRPSAARPPAGASAPVHVDAKRALATRMPEMKLGDVRLEDAIGFLQDTSGANIHVNWRALETVNITRETSVDLRLQSMPLRKLLKYVLMEADGQGLSTFYAEDGVIEITTRDMADQRLITKVYPVEDLLLTIPDFTDAPNFSLQSPQVSGGGGGGAGQSLLGNAGAGQENNQIAKSQRGQELVGLVMDTVQPEAWRENGGTGSIRFFRGRLIVTAPRSVHEQIGGAID